MIDKETINKKAEQYAEENNDCYTNDFYGFINGYNQALEDSHVTEMLEMLKELIYAFKGENLHSFQEERLEEAEHLIKKVENNKISVKNDK